MRISNIVLSITLCASQAVFAAGTYSGGITSGNLSVWRINEASGQVSLCSFESKSSAASCAKWSAKEKAAGDFRLIVGNDLLSVWRINRLTGEVSLCEYKDTEGEPACTPWSTGQ